MRRRYSCRPAASSDQSAAAAQRGGHERASRPHEAGDVAHVALPHVTGEPGEADAVAARDGKTRGAITNLFGSQAAYQTETMTRTEPQCPQVRVTGVRIATVLWPALRLVREEGFQPLFGGREAGRVRELNLVDPVADAERQRALWALERGGRAAEHGGAPALGPPPRGRGHRGARPLRSLPPRRHRRTSPPRWRASSRAYGSTSA